MSTQQTMDAQSLARKERLGQLKNLKRKQQNQDQQEPNDDEDVVETPTPVKNLALSGRNYDIETGLPKLGFDSAPNANQETLEEKAAEIAEETRKIKEKEENHDKGIDLFSLQPKKPNWDLKRDVDKKLEKLELRTNSAIARLVRERILAAKNSGSKKANGEDEAQGIEGDLSDQVRRREKEIEEENKLEDGEEL